MLDHKVMGGDLLIFKNLNDVLTICRGSLGKPIIDSIEVDGEELDWAGEVHPIHQPENPFTIEEIDHFIKHYDQIVGPGH